MHEQERLEIALEEWGEHSWIKAMINTISGSYASAQFRFVARPVGDHRDLTQDVVVGATFPVIRWQDFDDRTEPNAWMETMRERLDELDAELTTLGWERSEDRGDHWWSLRYTRSEPMIRKAGA